MRRSSSVDAIRMALLASLGLLGCGGATATANGNEGEPGQGADGSVRPDGTARDAAADGAMAGQEVGAPDAAAESTPSVSGSCTMHPCVNPQRLILADADTGFDTCQGGPLRRRAIVDCPVFPRTSGRTCPLADAGSGCGSDRDCTGAPNGYCQYNDGGAASGGGTPSCTCVYGCVRDRECQASSTNIVSPGTTNICVCGNPIGQCALAYCESPSSCQPGCDCIGVSTNEFVCQTPADDCILDSDCVNKPLYDSGLKGGSCTYSSKVVCASRDYSNFGLQGPVEGLTCQPGIACGTGRPFLVCGDERIALPLRRSDWLAPTRARDVRSASKTVRALLAHYWLRAGLMEHASVAAFARFTLHLLALGAPPDLVSLSQQAIGDETQHARLAFALASEYAGEDLGPGPLAIDGSLEGFTVAHMLFTLVREGCIGETLAATEAAEALSETQDPRARDVLRIIARDELRHANLAWRTLRWLVTSGLVNAGAARDAVASGLASIRAETPSCVPGGKDQDLRAFGVLGEARRAEIRLAAADAVIAACAAALLKDAEARDVAVWQGIGSSS